MLVPVANQWPTGLMIAPTPPPIDRTRQIRSAWRIDTVTGRVNFCTYDPDGTSPGVPLLACENGSPFQAYQ